METPAPSPSANINLGSYRTYEEWKLASSFLLYMLIPVLTVPMRNGNITPLKAMPPAEKVLTVPMRNGNEP